MSLLMNRRSLLRGLFAAPAVVAAGSLMPVRLWRPEFLIEREQLGPWTRIPVVYGQARIWIADKPRLVSSLTWVEISQIENLGELA